MWGGDDGRWGSIAYLGEGVTQDGLEGVLDLVDAEAVLDLGDDGGDLGDDRALLLGLSVR